MIARAPLLLDHSFQERFPTIVKTHSSIRGAEKGESTEMPNLVPFCIW